MKAELWKDANGRLHLLEPESEASRSREWGFVGTVELTVEAVPPVPEVDDTIYDIGTERIDGKPSTFTGPGDDLTPPGRVPVGD